MFPLRARSLPAFARLGGRLPAVLALLLAALPAHALDLPNRWRWSNPAPFGGNIFDLAYGFGLTVAVTERGQIFTSDDLVLWEPRDSGTTNSLRAVTFLGPRLVITGERGTVLYADSLQAFQHVSLGTPDWLEGVTASTNLLVAVGDNGAIYTSRDGAAWARQSTAITDWLAGVAWGQGTFVAVGERGTIATSANGTNWTRRTSNTTRNLKRVAWMNNQFWAVGDGGLVLGSAGGGANWTPVSSGATNTLFDAEPAILDQVIVGDNEVRLRRNTATWTNELAAPGPYPAPAWTYYNAQWEGSLFLLSGRSGRLVEGFQTNTAGPYSWVERQRSVRNWLWELRRLPEFYIAVGHRGTILTSVNGLDWALELPPDTATNATLLGVGGTTNLLLAVGEAGRILLSPNGITNVVLTNANGSFTTNAVSTLGIFWQALPPPTTNALQGVAVAPGLFVVSGENGTVLTSPDGTLWTHTPAPTTQFLTGIEHFPGGWVAVGRGGTVLTSPDAVTWTSRASGTTNWLYRVRLAGGQLIAVGQNGTVLTSSDGLAWTKHPTPTTAWLNDVTFLGGTYFAVGTQGAVLASSNAVQWIYLGTITEKSLYGVAAWDGQLVAAGVEGVLIRSQVIPDVTPPQFLSFSHQTNANVWLVAGQPDQRITLDRAVTFPDWATGPWFEFTDSSGTLLIVEPAGSNVPPFEFHRATLVP